MLKVKQSGVVGIYCMGRSIGAFVPYTVHAFLAGDTLIDTGTIYAQRELARALEGKRITTVLNTHHHEDHIGNNHFLQRRFNAQVYAPHDALGYLEHPHKIGLRFYQRFVWNWPEPSHGIPMGERITCPGYTFEAIPTPGHCPDHVCLYEPDRKWLFTGDIYCGRAVRYLRADEDFHTTLSSLKKIASLDIDTVFCCLKGAVPDGKGALLEKIGYMEGLKAKVIELHNQGASPVKIRQRLLGKEDAMFYLSNAHFSKQHVVDSILSEKTGTGH
ncbi:MAG: MBL fold metallo-hydrolase [Deltaproteobacteria bacterium]|nr:MBL fold metallo-hydrolase [Deltaproteobacteria bacterium]